MSKKRSDDKRPGGARGFTRIDITIAASIFTQTTGEWITPTGLDEGRRLSANLRSLAQPFEGLQRPDLPAAPA